MTSASSWMHPSWSHRLVHVKVVKWCLTLSSPPSSVASLPQTLPGLGISLTCENRGKGGIKYIHFSLVTRSPISLSNGPTLFLASLLLPTYLWRKPFLLSSTSLASFSSRWALAFWLHPYTIRQCLHILPSSLSLLLSLLVLRLS